MINKAYLKFFNFILELKKKYIYIYIYIYFLIKFNKVPIIGFNEFEFALKFLKFSFIFLLKKYIYNLKLHKIFLKFFLLQLYNKNKFYFNYFINYNCKGIFKIVKNYNFKVSNSLLALKKKNIYNKLPYCFFINKSKNKRVNKKKSFKNLFSLFFFNLFIYLFFIYLFIFWLNILLNNNKIKILKYSLSLLKFNIKIPFYKLCYKTNYKKKYIKIIYSLNNLKFNKYYLIYNKLNLIKQF